jgi:hypothetical protein
MAAPIVAPAPSYVVNVVGWWLGQHVRHDGKEMFDSEGQAVAVLQWYQSHGRGYGARCLVAYRCNVCGKWFLGHYAGDHVVCLEV